MFKARLKSIKQKLLDQKLDGGLISSVSNIAYLSGYSNFSKDEREAYIFIGKNFAYIITDGRYSEVIKKQVPHLTLFERGVGKSTDQLFKKHNREIKNLGIEEDNITVEEYKILKKHFKNLKHFDLKRSVKTEEEIKKIENACKLGDKTYQYILGKIKAGISEKELAFEIELFIKRSGAEISFPPIVAYGVNSSVPHHKTSDKRLTINDKLILLDFGAKVDGYCSDITRTVFFGKPTGKQREIYGKVLEAQKRAVDFIHRAIKNGQEIKAKDVDRVAREYITSYGYPSIPHSLGHGVGLEVHESPHLSPRSKEILREGMVFSIEPGVYIPNFGGVRIEDLFVLEKNSLRQITASPKDFVVI